MKPNVPERFQNASLEHLSSTFQIVVDYADKHWSGDDPAPTMPAKGLFLSGPPGVGKSYALAALTAWWSVGNSRNGDNVFITAPDLFECYPAIKDSTSSAFDTYRGQRWSKTLEEVPWLVINDLGKEYRGGKLEEQVAYQLGRLLRFRVERKKVTHFSSNLGFSQDPQVASVRSVYGESIYSLLKECCDVFLVTGPDRRGEPAPKRGVRQ